MYGHRFTFVLATVALSTGLLFAPSASAMKPDIIFFDDEGSATFKDVCSGFPIRFDNAGSGHTMLFYDRAGELRSIAFEGHYTSTVTNKTTGASVTLNVSGPGRVDPTTGDQALTGPWGLIEFDDPGTPDWEGYLLYAKGRTTISVDENGNDVLGGTVGVRRDICAELGWPPNRP